MTTEAGGHTGDAEMGRETVPRRQLLRGGAGLVTFGLAGCTGPTGESESDGGSASTVEARTTSGGDAATRDDTGTPSDSPFYSTRSDSIAYAGSLAADSAIQLGPVGNERPELVTWLRTGSSSRTSGDTDVVTSNGAIAVGSQSGGRFQFGSGRTFRLRNDTVGSSVTFEPDSDAGRYEIDRISVPNSFVGRDGIFLQGLSQTDRMEMSGTWSGDTGLFGYQAFARYTAELLEDGTVVGRTASIVVPRSYRWGMKQTADAMFVTRQPSTRSDWHVELRVGGDENNPLGSVQAIHRPAERVFEVPLADLSVDPGTYQWELDISEAETSDERLCWLGGQLGPQLVVG